MLDNRLCPVINCYEAACAFQSASLGFAVIFCAKVSAERQTEALMDKNCKVEIPVHVFVFCSINRKGTETQNVQLSAAMESK